MAGVKMDPPPITLVMVQGPRLGESTDFQPGSTIRIGLVMRGNNVPIKDAGISSKHLTVESGSGKWVLRDLGSSNGTILNSNILSGDTPFDLHDGDTLKLGETTSILVKIEGHGGGGVEVAGVAENRRTNPPRRVKALKGETESFSKEIPNLELERKENLRVTRSRKNEDSVNCGLVIPKVADNQETEVKRGKGPPGGRKKNQQEEKLEEKETNLKDKERTFAIKIEVDDDEELNQLRKDETKVRNDEGKVEEWMTENKENNDEIINEMKESCDELKNEVKEKCDEPKKEVKCDKRVEADLDKMTLGEWFDYLEIHLPKQIIEETEEVIKGMRMKAERAQEFMLEQKKGKVAVE